MIRAIGSSDRCTSVDRLPETSRERARQIEARAHGGVHDACEQETSSAYLHNRHSIFPERQTASSQRGCSAHCAVNRLAGVRWASLRLE